MKRSPSIERFKRVGLVQSTTSPAMGGGKISLPEAFSRAVIAYKDGKLSEAERLCRAILAVKPDFLNALRLLASVQMRLGRANDALASFEQALAVHPNDAVLFNNRGTILQKLERFDEALISYEQAIALRPDYADALYNRGVLFQAWKRLDQALASYDQALMVQPNHAAALNNRSAALRDLERYEDALTSYKQALAAHPDDATAFNNIGVILQELNRFEEALASYERAITLRPNYADAFYNRGVLLHELKRFEEALESFEHALAVRPNYAEALNNRGNTLQALNRFEDALESYEQALAVRPDYAEAHNNLGNGLLTLGRLHEASDAFEKAIALAPRRAAFYLSVVKTKRVRRDDQLFSAMTELAREISSLSVEEQIALHFALAKALAEIGDHAQSFEHLLKGNALARKQINYDEAATLAQLERIRTVFSAELMRERQGQGHASPLPIFIIGMPRSGTTLVEQILASHPKIFGAGELSILNNLAKEVSGPEGSSFPEWVLTIPAEQIRRFGERYVSALRSFAPQAERVTDKMPYNFRFAGLIHLALPDARIIHVRRDLRDTALSCFSQKFAQGQGFSYDLTELGRYCRAYQVLMEHWWNLLPKEMMLEVDYEDLIDDLERQARRIVCHCSLEWDNACLAFYRNQRPVQTASSTQVRRPIYRTSVGRWRQYQDVLQPLLRALYD